jgi:hypothetical protein
VTNGLLRAGGAARYPDGSVPYLGTSAQELVTQPTRGYFQHTEVLGMSGSGEKDSGSSNNSAILKGSFRRAKSRASRACEV